MIRTLKKFIHVTELKDGESAMIHKWNGGLENAGVAVTRKGDNLLKDKKLTRCDFSGRFFNSDDKYGGMVLFADTSHHLFTLQRIS